MSTSRGFHVSLQNIHKYIVKYMYIYIYIYSIHYIQHYIQFLFSAIHNPWSNATNLPGRRLTGASLFKSTFTALWCVIYLHTLHWSNTADGRNPASVDINYHHLPSFIHLRCLAGFLPSTVPLRKVIVSSRRTLRLLTIYYNKVLQVDKSVVQLVPSNITQGLP